MAYMRSFRQRGAFFRLNVYKRWGFHQLQYTKARGGAGGTPLQEANRNVPLDAGSHFHDWIGYNGVAFSIDLLEWGRKFFGFLG